MKRTFTQPPVIPPGYDGRSFNKWVADIQRPLDKIRGTNVTHKLRATGK